MYLRHMQNKYEVDMISHWENMDLWKSIYQMLTNKTTKVHLSGELKTITKPSYNRLLLAKKYYHSSP